MDLVTGMAVAGQALDILRKLKDLDADLKNAEVKMQLAELYGKVAELKVALADASIELRQRDDTIVDLKDKARTKVRTMYHNGFNFGLDADGRPLIKPFCPICEQREGLQIMLQYKGSGAACPSCQGVFDGRMTSAPELSD